MIRNLLVLMLIAVANSVCAQFDSLSPYVSISGYVTDTSERKLSDVFITVIENNDTLYSFNTLSNGKYRYLKFNQGKIVTLSFSKDNYIIKSILIDTKTNYFEPDVSQLIEMDIPIHLDKKQSEKDYSSVMSGFIIGKLVLDVYGGLSIDYEYTSNQRKLYNATLEKLLQQ